MTTMTKTRERTSRTLPDTLPARSERLDRSFTCDKCGNSPIKVISRGDVTVERSCAACGTIRFCDVPDIAL